MEPLKNKEGYVNEWEFSDKTAILPEHRIKVFEEENIRSAVEWLKEEIYKLIKDTIGNVNHVEVLTKIDEAFADVVKEEKWLIQTIKY